MPIWRDQKGHQFRVDICISPISVIKRRSMSLLYEMMLAKKAVAEDTHFCVDPMDSLENLDFKALVKEGWGEKEQLWLGNQPLPQKTFVAPLFWMRLDKLAREQLSAQTGPTVLNHLGLPTDSAKMNGQKRDFSKGMAFFQRHLEDVLKWTVLENTTGVDQIENLVRVLEPDFSILNWSKNGNQFMEAMQE